MDLDHTVCPCISRLPHTVCHIRRAKQAHGVYESTACLLRITKHGQASAMWSLLHSFNLLRNLNVSLILDTDRNSGDTKNILLTRNVRELWEDL